MRKGTTLEQPYTEARAARYLRRKKLKPRQIAALLRAKNTVANIFADLQSGSSG